jgi:hypothetical protein
MARGRPKAEKRQHLFRESLSKGQLFFIIGRLKVGLAAGKAEKVSVYRSAFLD